MSLSHIRRHLALALAAPFLLASQASQAEVQVVTSIKPLELLVRAVAPEDVQVTTLVPPGASPHTYTLRPSQRRALSEADAIFWIGPDMETFLERLLAGSDFRDRSHALNTEPGAGHPHHDHADHDEDAHADDDHDHDHDHDHDEDAHASEHDHDHGHHHDHGDGPDPHLWVDPAQALKMAHQIRDVLAGLDKMDKAELDRNLDAFEAALTAKEQAIREQLEPAKDISLFAYHSALTRFAEHYGLHLAGILTLNPELSPGARHVQEVQEKLAKANHPCLLTEPQFNRQWWLSITEGLDLTFSTWDPLAIDIPATPDGYLAFQQSIADAVMQCLPEQAQH